MNVRYKFGIVAVVRFADVLNNILGLQFVRSLAALTILDVTLYMGFETSDYFYWDRQGSNSFSAKSANAEARLSSERSKEAPDGEVQVRRHHDEIMEVGETACRERCGGYGPRRLCPLPFNGAACQQERRVSLRNVNTFV